MDVVLVLHGNPRRSWHWEEKNHTKWMTEFITAKLLGTVSETHEATAAITDVIQCTGDAALNVRKGKQSAWPCSRAAPPGALC